MATSWPVLDVVLLTEDALLELAGTSASWPKTSTAEATQIAARLSRWVGLLVYAPHVRFSGLSLGSVPRTRRTASEPAAARGAGRCTSESGIGHGATIATSPSASASARRPRRAGASPLQSIAQDRPRQRSRLAVGWLCTLAGRMGLSSSSFHGNDFVAQQISRQIIVSRDRKHTRQPSRCASATRVTASSAAPISHSTPVCMLPSLPRALGT